MIPSYTNVKISSHLSIAIANYPRDHVLHKPKSTPFQDATEQITTFMVNWFLCVDFLDTFFCKISTPVVALQNYYINRFYKHITNARIIKENKFNAIIRSVESVLFLTTTKIMH